MIGFDPFRARYIHVNMDIDLSKKKNCHWSCFWVIRMGWSEYFKQKPAHTIQLPTKSHCPPRTYHWPIQDRSETDANFFDWGLKNTTEGFEKRRYRVRDELDEGLSWGWTGKWGRAYYRYMWLLAKAEPDCTRCLFIWVQSSFRTWVKRGNRDTVDFYTDKGPGGRARRWPATIDKHWATSSLHLKMLVVYFDHFLLSDPTQHPSGILKRQHSSRLEPLRSPHQPNQIPPCLTSHQSNLVSRPSLPHPRAPIFSLAQLRAIPGFAANQQKYGLGSRLTLATNKSGQAVREIQQRESLYLLPNSLVNFGVRASPAMP